MIKPNNIHCLALNYRGVGANNESPLYFVKSVSSLCSNGASVPYPKNSSQLWTEVELTIVLRKDCKDISIEESPEYIEGYVVGADITCKNLYSRDHHLGFSKSRENFCPTTSDVIQTELYPNAELITEINGTITQRGVLGDMKYDAYHCLSFVSSITLLKAGDIILTGTPSGVENNILNPGDNVRQIIENIGALEYEIR